MAHEVKQANIFGRIGTGIGKGLADQVPKEIDRYRLAKGLQELGKKKDLTPFQQFAELSAIPGITPQMIQSGSELLKQQGIRNNYANRAARRSQSEDIPNFQSLEDVPFGGTLSQGKRARTQSIQEKINENDVINEPGQPQIVNTNPLRTEAQPVAPWTPEKRDQEISVVLEDNPNLTLQEAVNIATDNERRYLAQPEAERARDDYLRQVRSQIDDEFKKQIETKLQKTGEGIYQDVTGENLIRAKRLIEKDLRTNPNANVSDVVNARTNQILDLAKTKSQLNTLANRDFSDKIFKGKQTLDKLKSYQPTFEKTGNSEEYFNILKNNFGLSPQPAASISYPLNSRLEKYIKNIKPLEHGNDIDYSRKYASDIADMITAKDSLLSIAYALRMKDLGFNQRSFFDQLRTDRDSIAITPRIERELGEGEADVFPNWGDIWIMPLLRGF